MISDLPIVEGVRSSANGRGKFSGVGDSLEIAAVILVLHGRLEGGINLSLDEGLDGDGGEPLVTNNVASSGLQVTVTLGQIRSQELLAQGLGILVEVLGEVNLAGENLLINSHGLVIAERRLANNHFINKDAKGPPVYRLAVTLVEEHLGSDVLGSAAQGVGTAAGLNDLGETEIGQLAVTVLAQEKILGLQITMDNVLAVDVLEGKRDLEGVKLGLLVGELAVLAEMGEKLATGDDLHHDEHVVVILERGNHRDDEGAIELVHEGALGVDMVNLLELDDLVLLHELAGIAVAVGLVLGELNATERTAAKGSDHLEVPEAGLRVQGELRGGRHDEIFYRQLPKRRNDWKICGVPRLGRVG